MVLGSLLNSGLLASGEELVCEPRRGERYKATLREDGSIYADGTKFDTPSRWASHVAGNQVNGWKVVTARGKPLDMYRKQVVVGPRGFMGLPQPPASQQTATKAEQPGQQGSEALQPDLRQQLLQRLHELALEQFEHLVGEFLKAKGLTVVRSRGGPGDEGVDGECTVPFLKLKVAFQAKRYAAGHNVGIDPVQRLRGSMTGGFDRGIFIITSSYSPAAEGWVQETGAPITLIDGNELVDEMIRMGLGVKAIPVVEAQIDEVFFEGLGA